MSEDTKDIVTVEHLPATREEEAMLPSSTAAFALIQARAGLRPKIAALLVTQDCQPHNIIDYGGRVGPGFDGPCCEAMARSGGLKFWDRKIEKIMLEGGHYYFEVEGKCGWNSEEYVEIIGSCSSKKPFFSKAKGKDVKIVDINIMNVKKNAITNFTVNGVTRFLGLRGISWEQLAEMTDGKLTRERATGVDFQSGQVERTEEEQIKADMVWKWLLEMNGQGVKEAKAQLQKLTAFKDFKGYNNIQKVSGKKLPYLFKDVERLYNQWGGGDIPTGKTKAAPKTKANAPAPAGNAELIKKAEELQKEITGMNPDYGDAYYAHTLSELGFRDLDHIASDQAKMSEYLNILLRLTSDLKAVSHSHFKGEQE